MKIEGPAQPHVTPSNEFENNCTFMAQTCLSFIGFGNFSCDQFFFVCFSHLVPFILFLVFLGLRGVRPQADEDEPEARTRD